MKIKKIEFKKHIFFNNHTVSFTDKKISNIVFLVGNNGAGKTKILEIIYQVFFSPFEHREEYEVNITILFSDKEKQEFSLIENEVIYTVTNTENIKTTKVRYKSGAETGINLRNLSKVIYSTVEVNFKEEKIRSVTSKDIDNVIRPKEKSQNLSTEIPQLLVDIKSLDERDIGKWFKENKEKGHKDPFPSIGNRFERFANAFHKIYEGEKTFSEIKNDQDSKKIIFTDSKGGEVDLNNMSTGEKQIIYRVGYILKNLANISEGIILIDEPEISLHPTWQTKFKDFLFEIFKDYNVQIIIATHSPYIFKNFDNTKEECIKIDRTKVNSEKISVVFPNVPYTPSVNLINYLAYGIIDELLHIELYTLLQIKEKRDRIKNSWNKSTQSKNQDGIEDWLQDSNGGNMPIKQTFFRGTKKVEETIMTWIRNKIHHSDENSRPNFDQNDLKKSIDEMIKLLER